MQKDNAISRRSMLGAAAAGIAAVTLSDQAEAQQPGLRRRAATSAKPSLKFDNADFYGKDGKFDEEKGKDAIMRLCAYHNYPIYPGLREKIWIFDYGIGQFTSLGLACVGFCNHVAGEYSYMLQDLFLLPGQMLPEHWHIKPEKTENCAQKDEGWLIRWGRSYVVGEGDANLPPEVVVPKCHNNGEVSVKHCIVADPGVFVPLSKVGTKHWQYGGKEGVILTEVANAHDNASVRHADPVCNEAFLKL